MIRGPRQVVQRCYAGLRKCPSPFCLSVPLIGTGIPPLASFGAEGAEDVAYGAWGQGTGKQRLDSELGSHFFSLRALACALIRR